MPHPTERIYIAGPMTGLPAFNHDAFNRVDAHLQSLGFATFNPAAMFPHTDRHWTFYMRHALQGAFDLRQHPTAEQLASQQGRQARSPHRGFPAVRGLHESDFFPVQL